MIFYHLTFHSTNIFIPFLFSVLCRIHTLPVLITSIIAHTTTLPPSKLTCFSFWRGSKRFSAQYWWPNSLFVWKPLPQFMSKIRCHNTNKYQLALQPQYLLVTSIAKGINDPGKGSYRYLHFPFKKFINRATIRFTSQIHLQLCRSPVQLHWDNWTTNHTMFS